MLASKQGWSRFRSTLIGSGSSVPIPKFVGICVRPESGHQGIALESTKPTLRLLADDLTGALDTAAEFVGVTGPVPAFWHGAIPAALPANAALDSGTRERDAADAAALVARLTPALAGAAIAFKKIDSLLRGPALAEVASCLRAGPWARAAMAPAFPYQGRITRGGVQFHRDHDGHWVAGRDIIAGLRATGVQVHVGTADAMLPPGVSVFDAATDDDLRRVVAIGRACPDLLWIGSGGLAQALADGATAAMDAPLAEPVLGLFGSDHPTTARQLASCGDDWLKLRDRNLPVLHGRLRSTGRALVSVDLPPGLARDAAARRIATSLDNLVQSLDRPGTLMVAGGETLRGLCRSLGATSIEVRGRIVPGLPRSVLRGGAWDGVAVVSKSGAFGPPDLLRNLLRRAPAAIEGTG